MARINMGLLIQERQKLAISVYYPLRDQKPRYVNADAPANNCITLATESLPNAAAFNTIPEAEAFWRSVQHKFVKPVKATIVKVENVCTVKRVEVKPVLNGVEKGLGYVIVGFNGRFRNAAGGWDESIEKAYSYSSVGETIHAITSIAAARRSADGITGITAYRQATDWSFKVTPVSPIDDEVFQTFPITGSSVVRSLAYSHTSKKLRITLERDGKPLSVDGERMQPDSTYEYSNVDPKDVFEFLAAPSKGSFYSCVFKAKYDRGAQKVG